ncbi:phosphotransferase [Diaporthe helianthi]|uniref:Phosphotransferase n=1 Tax=Diaporthe helianthi TaxID=158607 RepID=A0A2P5HMZ8_DIAHE|nr:phosphotransferase [Diaporthe helianthi]
MSEINYMVGPEDQDFELPWADFDDLQYEKAEALRRESLKKFSEKSFRDLVQNIAREKIGDPRLKLNPTVGPYFIMERVEHLWSMSQRLNKNFREEGARYILDIDVSRTKLKALDVQMVRFLLQIFSYQFPRIGTLARSETSQYFVQGRPLSLDIQLSIETANVPESALPSRDKTYSTADEWYTACSRINTAPLLFQQNDLFFSADDFRNKCVARLLFHQLASEGKLSTFGFEEDTWSAQAEEFRAQSKTLCPAPRSTGDFVLWCDDLRPENILLGKADKITGIIDWEFTYVAPTQFSLDPPWWLYLQPPHDYDDGGLEGFIKTYNDRVKTWLEAVEDVEKESEFASLGLPHGIGMSRYMRESWETGRFWLSYATRKAWGFDEVYWKCLDERLFGKRPDDVPRERLWTTRLHLLTDRERDFLEPFVRRRGEETKERKLIDCWDIEEVRKRFREFLGEP